MGITALCDAGTVRETQVRTTFLKQDYASVHVLLFVFRESVPPFTEFIREQDVPFHRCNITQKVCYCKHRASGLQNSRPVALRLTCGALVPLSGPGFRLSGAATIRSVSDAAFPSCAIANNLTSARQHSSGLRRFVRLTCLCQEGRRSRR
jgi:hypothetical protein